MSTPRSPVFSEGIQVYFTEEKMMRVYQVVVVLLALSLFLSWPKKPFRYFLAFSADPPTYSIMIISVFVVAAYLSARFGLHSYSGHRFKSITCWLSSTALPARSIAIQKFGLLVVHSLFLTLLTLPFLVVAASPSGVPMTSVFLSLLVVYTCTLAYRLIALFLLMVFEKRMRIAAWILWTLIFIVCLTSLYLFPKASPALNLLGLAGAGPEWQQSFQAFGITIPYAVLTLPLHVTLGLFGAGASVFWLAVKRRFQYKAVVKRSGEEELSHG